MSVKEKQLEIRGVRFDSTDMTFLLMPQDMSEPATRVSLEMLTDILACAGIEHMPGVTSALADAFKLYQSAIREAEADPQRLIVLGPAYKREGRYWREVTLRMVRFTTTRAPDSPKMVMLPSLKGRLYEPVPTDELPDPDTCENERVMHGVERVIPKDYLKRYSAETFQPEWMRPVEESTLP